MTFASLGLADTLLRAVAAQGYDTPTPIQLKGIPAVLSGRDVMGAAQTGTGKTAAFTLPLLQKLAENTPPNRPIRALILSPTRELAAQIHASVVDYGKFLSLRSAVVFGGVNINPQIDQLRKGVDILIATPGRLLDLHSQGVTRFSGLEILVLDEADRMLDMGFIRDIRRILAVLPARRQNLLFSATFCDEIRQLAKGLLHQPVEISVTPERVAAETVEQHVYQIDQDTKPALLSHLIRSNNWHQVLVFTRTKHGADRLAKRLLRDNIDAAAIHGNKSQNARTRALADFKGGRVQVLVATDIAARGLDIEELPQVVNFELPHVPEDYVHRIGRTGRAGSTGAAVSLVSREESAQLKGIERLLRRSLPRVAVPQFESLQPVAAHVAPTSVAPNPPRQNQGKRRPQNGSNANRGGNGNRGAGSNGNGARNGNGSGNTNGNNNGNRAVTSKRMSIA